MINTVIQGDCLEIMPQIPDHSVDMVLADLPYGTTACKWDSVIPFEPLWEQYKRVIKPRGAIVLTASQPFTTKLIMSNFEWFKYSWVWKKDKAPDFYGAKYRPMTLHEDICVFSPASATFGAKALMSYYPVMEERQVPITYTVGTVTNRKNPKGKSFEKYAISPTRKTLTHRFPTSIISFTTEKQNGKYHPTQKPVPLFEYLIRTYTNEGETVLDNTAGSGTTAIAAIRSNRNYILIEKEPEYVEICKRRIAEELAKPRQLELVG